MKEAIKIVSYWLKHLNKEQAIEVIGNLNKNYKNPDNYDWYYRQDIEDLTTFLLTSVVPCFIRPEPKEKEIEKLEVVDESNRRFKLPESVLNITKEDIDRLLNPNEIVKHVYSSGNVSYKCTCGTRFDEPAKEDNE